MITTFEKKCAECGEKRSAKTKLQKCSKCNSVRYCSRECQKTHWVIHKAVCKEIAERQQAIADAARLNEVFDVAVDYLRARDFRKFESLIHENLDVLNHQSEEFQRNCLLFACAGLGIPQAAKMLLDKQADVNIQNVEGVTPLYMACNKGHNDIVKMLLDKQADINIHNVEGGTPLFMACHKGHKDIVKMLMKKQANVNIQNVEGVTPLFIACENGHKDIVKVFLDKQADVNIQTVEGATPLAIACQKGHEEISELLRQHGAV